MGPSCFGVWSGGRFMNFGRDIGAERLAALVRRAHEKGVRTFVTADVYGAGEADRLLGDALAPFDRKGYRLIGAIGHDIYKGERREGVYPRFTNPALRGPEGYAEYLRMAAGKSLERLRTDRFDLLLLHNPDSIGYTHPAVYEGLAALRDEGLTELVGLAPGPANGFTLDLIGAFEKYGELLDWAMIILGPMEPWPGRLVLPAAEKNGIRILARVVDYGGMFLDGLRPGARLPKGDHRAFRPPGWIEAAHPKMERFREMARAHGATLLQLAGLWTLAQPAVKAVVPTLLQEDDPAARPIEDQLDDLAGLPANRPLPTALVEEMGRFGDNANGMALKGASPQYLGRPQEDQWPIEEAHREIARRWELNPERDLTCPGDPRDLRETGARVRGVPQASTRRLYALLQAFGACRDPSPLAGALEKCGLEHVLYLDAHDPRGVAVLLLTEDPEEITGPARLVLSSGPFGDLVPKPELTMLGRTYSSGREPDLLDTLLRRPRRYAFDPANSWAVWYPLRRRPEFNLLPQEEQGRILMEHAMIGRVYGQAGYAQDIRLACFGLDRNDNEFVIGLVGADLHPLSRLVQEMRKSQQTAKYIQSLGPFFVGRVFRRSPGQEKKV